jgi:hypothetical protein
MHRHVLGSLPNRFARDIQFVRKATNSEDPTSAYERIEQCPLRAPLELTAPLMRFASGVFRCARHMSRRLLRYALAPAHAFQVSGALRNRLHRLRTQRAGAMMIAKASCSVAGHRGETLRPPNAHPRALREAPSATTDS